MTIPLTRKYCNEKDVEHSLIYELLTTKINLAELDKGLSGSTKKGAVIPVYGVKITDTWNRQKSITEIPNISTSKKDIEHLLQKMAKGLVLPMTAQDIVDDFIGSA